MSKTLNTKPLREQVADVLRLKIVKGELKPGDRISERDLSVSLNISTTPVKEALRILGTSGLLVTSPRKGTVVSEFAAQNLRQVSILRSALEGASANLAALNITDAEYTELALTMKTAGELLEKDEVEQLEEVNSRFHRIINECSRNTYLSQLIEAQMAFTEGFRLSALSSYEARKLSYNEHLEILEAMKKRDGELAENLMRNHIRRSSLYTFNNLEQSPEPLP